MSTFTDGAPPSVTPEPGDSGPEHGRGPDDATAEPATDWLQQEIQRRIAAKSSGSGGRHARRDASGRNGAAQQQQQRRSDGPGGALPPPIGSPVQPPPRRLRTDRPGQSAAWSGPQRPDQNGGPQERPAVPARPAPPSGSAAARLLSLPPVTPPPVTPPPASPPPATPAPVGLQQPTGPHQAGPPAQVSGPHQLPPPVWRPQPSGPHPIPLLPSLPARVQPTGPLPVDQGQPDEGVPDGLVERAAPARSVADQGAPPQAAVSAPSAPPRPQEQPAQQQPAQQQQPPAAPVEQAAAATRSAPPAPPQPQSPQPQSPQPQPGYGQQAFAPPSHPTFPPRPQAPPADVGEVIWSASVTATAPYPPVSTPPPGTVSVPEQRSATPGALFDDRPDGRSTDGRSTDGSADTDDENDDDLPNKRVRVVLAERKGVARPVRTVVDIQEGTGVGELLRSNLIGSQLTVALRFAVFAGLTLGVLPVLFALVPEIGRISVLGLRLPWLILGVLVYPFLLGLGWWHTRTAERVEQNFADHVQD
ncbi:hypothetical protein [Pseudonocardia sp. GCM10023141]|uniref:hypothetical protein n=1 Tax=Pseudonocardia sp. GCM10023141 TaxID=3252653 RepID=UPI00361C5C6B